jgi:hypothetical protein
MSAAAASSIVKSQPQKEISRLSKEEWQQHAQWEGVVQPQGLQGH